MSSLHMYTKQQRMALNNPCLLAFECAQPKYFRLAQGGTYSVGLTINNGWEWLEAEYGGPVFHVSVAPQSRLLVSQDFMRRMALEALGSAGDASRGEWHEWTGYAYHIRRRISEQEEAIVGKDARDIRGTDEAIQRFHAAKGNLSAAAIQAAKEELVMLG